MSLVVASLAACASSPLNARADRPLPAGTWGGDHIEMTVTASDVHFEFDCASADIAKVPVLDDQGRLAADGTYTKEHGGALRQDEVPDRQAARFTGLLKDKTLTVDVTIVDSKQLVAQFAVTLDAVSRVRKCR